MIKTDYKKLPIYENDSGNFYIYSRIQNKKEVIVKRHHAVFMIV